MTSIDDTCCFKCCSLLAFLRTASILLTLLYSLSSVFFFIYGIQHTPIYFAFSLISIGFSLLTYLYYRGLQQELDGMMLPFLVSELILRVVLGLALFALWALSILSFFNLFQAPFYIDGLDKKKSLFLCSILASCAFAVHLRLFFHFYTGYQLIERLNESRKICANESCYMGLNLTARPTLI